MPFIDKPTLELLQQTAVDAEGAKNKAHLFQIPCEPKHIYGAVTSDGEFERLEAAPEPRNHALVTLDEVLHFAKFAAGQPLVPLIEGPTTASDPDDPTDPANEDTPPQVIVWYDTPSIVVILDDLTRRDRATLKLDLTPQMQTLLKIQKDETKFDQRAFRRLLKIDLHDCRNDDVLLNWVSQVKFTNNSTAAGNIANQKASFGRAVEESAASEQGECPDEICLQLRVFDDPSLRGTWPVRCAVEVLPSESSFRLVPLPLELHNAIESELSVIGQMLAEGLDCPVFRGRP